MNYGRLISGGGRLFRRMCTEATVAERPAKKPNLYQMLSEVGRTGKSMSQTLNEYIMEGKAVEKWELDSCAQELRKDRRTHQALEIMEWMEVRKTHFRRHNFALHLDLVFKANGVVAAEIYFTSLPPPAKNQYTYGALLNCYCNELMADKALSHFDKMDELGYLTSSAFACLMSMYLRLGQPLKVPQLVTDMKLRNFPMTSFTYGVWMNSCASLNDLAGVQRVYKEMMTEEDKHKGYWKTYSNLAAIYVKVDQFENAELMLRKLEQVMKPQEREAYHFLLTLYAGTGNLKEVYRVWESLKAISPVTNQSYYIMLSTLRRLNDMEGIIKYFKEWKSRCVTYDKRLISIAVSAYLSQNMDEEAASVFKVAIRRCKGPFFGIRDKFMMFFLEKGQLDGAVSHLEAALSEVTDDKWHPSPQVVSAFLKYYEKETGLDGVDELCKIFMAHNVDDSCLKTCIPASESSSEIHPILKEDSCVNHAHENL